MTPERWQQVRSIFDSALALPPEARKAFIDQACLTDHDLRAEVLSLLDAHQDPATFLEQGPLVASSRARSSDIPDLTARGLDLPARHDAAPTPETIGPYRIERQIGHGGMGTVYVAVRADRAYHQQVAVKLLRPGLDTEDLVRRFRVERQILATLDHPNITKLLDGGATEDGRPYLVMEHVVGVPIDAYCARHQLSIRDRVELFRKVCDTVQFAHQNLVVHRDLKPSNILVTQAGEPKLLDFGIAKLLGPTAFPQTIPETVPGVLPMTPAYASPEQVRGRPVSTASDLYALGVVLYELLTGRRPYAVSALSGHDLVEAICDQVPTRPSVASGPPTHRASTEVQPSAPGAEAEPAEKDSTEEPSPESTAQARATADLARWRPQLRGDLDNIVMMALRKDPQRRYASAERMAQDLRCFLHHEPVSARPDQWSYRATKFVRRNRLGVGVTASVFLVLCVLVGALAWQRQAITDERDRFRAIANVVVNMFELPDPARNRGLQVTGKELLDQAVRSTEGQFAEQPAFRAELDHTIGLTFKGLGLYPEAASHLEQAWKLRDTARGADDEADQSLIELAHVHALAGDHDASERLARQALDRTLGRHGNKHPNVVAARYRLAHALTLQGRYDDAEATFRLAIDTARELDLGLPLAQLLRHFGVLLRERARYDEGEAVLREALVQFERSAGEAHPGYALATNNLGVLLLERGAPEQAEALLERSLSVQRQLFDGPHPEVATALNNLGRVARAQGDYARANERLTEALDVLVARYGEAGHPHHATTLSNLADLRADQGDREEAESLYRQALAQRRRILDPDHPAVAESLNNLARIVQQRGDLDTAAELFEEALAISRRAFGNEHPQGAAILTNLGQLALRERALDLATEHFEKAIAILDKTLGDGHPESIAPRVGLGDVLRLTDRLDEAIAVLEDARTIADSVDGAPSPDAAAVRVKLAQIQITAGQHTRAEPLLVEALAYYEAHFDEDYLWTAATRFQLATCLFEQGKIARAEPLLEATFDRLRADYGLENKATRDMLGKMIEANEALGQQARAEALRALLDTPSRD